jgi:hypothetical protein
MHHPPDLWVYFMGGSGNGPGWILGMMASGPGTIWQPVVSVSGFSPPLKNSSILMKGCLASVVFDDILLLCLKNQEEA